MSSTVQNGKGSKRRPGKADAYVDGWDRIFGKSEFQWTPALKCLEIDVMAHRYLYYVMDFPVISDYEYDMLERKAVEKLPSHSPVHSVGSNLSSDYSLEVFNRAKKLSKK